MVAPATVAALAASQAGRRVAARAGAGFVASRVAGQAASRTAKSGIPEQVAEEIAGQSVTAGDVPGASNVTDLGDLL